MNQPINPDSTPDRPENSGSTEEISVQAVPSVRKKDKPPYVGFTLKQRLLPTILLALAAPLTLFVFGPFDIFVNNLEEFSFALKDFLPLNLLLALACSAVLVGVLLPLRGRAFDVVYAVIFWLSLMLFVQGNYLNFGITSLIGDGVGEGGIKLSAMIINTVIWIGMGVLCLMGILLFRKKQREIVRLVGIIAMVTVLGMQLVSCGITTVTSGILSPDSTEETVANHTETASGQTVPEDSTSPEAESVFPSVDVDRPEWIKEEKSDPKYFLTYEHLDEVSSGKNIIYFIVDRFDWEYYDKAMAESPEIFYNLDDGFTHFPDTIALYARTYPSAAYMITGVKYDPAWTRKEFFRHAYAGSPFLACLQENGYRINLYTDTFYAYEGYSYMGKYAANLSGSKGYTIDSAFGLSADMTALSLYRYAPLAAKGAFAGMQTSQFNEHVVYKTDAPKYTGDMKNVYEYLMEHDLRVVDNEKQYSFIHIAGTHLPNRYDENFNPCPEDKRMDAVCALKQSFKIINRYIDQMKELGVYEDATIIITGDHASIGSDMDVPLWWPHVTALFVKPSGSTGTALKTSHAQISHDDMFATILKSEGIPSEAFGRSVFDIPEGEERNRPYYFHSLQRVNGHLNHEIVEFRIHGYGNDYKNWEIVRREHIGKSIYD